MTRFTEKAESGKGYLAAAGSVEACAGGWQGPAIERLAAFENLHAQLERRMQEIPETLAAMRAQGKEKTVRFRELTGEKMMAQAWLAMAADYGINK